MKLLTFKDRKKRKKSTILIDPGGWTVALLCPLKYNLVYLKITITSCNKLKKKYILKEKKKTITITFKTINFKK